MILTGYSPADYFIHITANHEFQIVQKLADSFLLFP